jgi:hypothetical protein
MYVSSIRLLLVCLLVGAVAFGASPSLGLAVANGSFQLDQSKVYGNATLFDGSLIQTAAVSSDLVLQNGARLRLGVESQARVHSDRLVLEKGQTEIASASGYSIEALGLRAVPDSPQSRLVVTYSGPTRIQVAALAGSARISGANGVLVANVPAGTALDLNPQVAGAAAPSKILGFLKSKNGTFLLTDEVSHVTYVLIGSDLDQYVGERVEVTGDIDTGAQVAEGSPRPMRVLAIVVVPSNQGVAGFLLNPPGVIVSGVAIVAAGTTAGVLATRGSATPAISAP